MSILNDDGHALLADLPIGFEIVNSQDLHRLRLIEEWAKEMRPHLYGNIAMKWLQSYDAIITEAK